MVDEFSCHKVVASRRAFVHFSAKLSLSAQKTSSSSWGWESWNTRLGLMPSYNSKFFCNKNICSTFLFENIFVLHQRVSRESNLTQGESPWLQSLPWPQTCRGRDPSAPTSSVSTCPLSLTSAWGSLTSGHPAVRSPWPLCNVPPRACPRVEMCDGSWIGTTARHFQYILQRTIRYSH